MKIFSSTIAYNIPIRSDIYRMGLRLSGIGEMSHPGQFIMIRVSRYFDPILCRPFSIHRLHLEEGEGIEIVYRVVGRGTESLSHLSMGDRVNGFGPLGKGFTIIKDRIPIIVAGGIGIAPLMALAESFSEKNMKDKGIVFIGAERKEGLLFIDELLCLGWMVKVSTEDGSMGYKGIVTQLLHEELNKLPPEGHAIYACGPHEMLRSIAMMSKNYGIPCQVSLESRMACGIGACMGCSLRVLPERGKDVARENPYKRVCLDGPVFNSREVDWNSL